MLFRIYLDDSEDHASKFFGVGGFIGAESSWACLETQWLSALPAGIEFFHATDCFSGNNQFEPPRGFNRDRRIGLLNTLTDLICQTP